MSAMSNCGFSAEESQGAAKHDNFFTPQNYVFYSSNQYSDLDYTKQEIRLLEILSTDEDGTLEVKLVTGCFIFSRGAQPEYCAISYHAGDYKDTTFIKVNGIAFYIFSNLARSLKQIARVWGGELEAYPRLIWVDQICINQSNQSERSYQVSFMREIFQNATAVLACPGLDQITPRWPEIFNHFYTLLDGEGSCETSSLPDWGRLDGTKVYIDDSFFADFSDPDFLSNWGILGEIFGSSWWSRGWVYQEIIVAKKVFLIIGSGIENWDRFATLIRLAQCVTGSFIRALLMNGKSGIYDQSVKYARRVDEKHAVFMLDTREQWKEGVKPDMQSLFIQSAYCKVSDERDKIFAFMGLANPNYTIIPDYTRDIAFAYRQVCKRIVQYERSLNILAFSTQKKRTDLPSWTIDWSVDDQDSWLHLPDPSRFQASLDHRSAASFHPNCLGVPDSVLRVQCLILDQVAYANTIGHPKGLTAVNREIVLQNWSRIKSREKDELEEKYFNGESISDAYNNTMLKGRLEEELDNEPPSSSIEYTLWNDYATEYGDSMECLFFRSPKGYIGLVKDGVRYTDYICVLLGLDVPFVLRKMENGYVFVGVAYIHGLMNGEAIKMMEQGELILETIDVH